MAFWLALTSGGVAETLRVATFNVSLGRDGPGLLLRDILKGEDQQIGVVAAIILKVRPDILLLNDFDGDLGLVALTAFRDQLAQLGLAYHHLSAPISNSGFQSGVDLDGDGRPRRAADAFGFGNFPLAQSMAVVSRFPIDGVAIQNFSNLLWKDLEGANLPMKNGQPWPSKAAWNVQRLSSKGHWDIPVMLPDGAVLHLLASHPTPPVFDGIEDQNGMRNRDEIRFWQVHLKMFSPDDLFVILGDLNADPNDGEGSHDAVNNLLNHPLVQDVRPFSDGAVQASYRQKGPNLSQKSDPAFDTVDWDEGRTPGNMRVDYVLPSASLQISGAGVFWPTPDEDGFDLVGLNGDVGSHHRLVWIDIAR